MLVIGEKLHEDDIDLMIEDMDHNGDGTIDIREFATYMAGAER